MPQEPGSQGSQPPPEEEPLVSHGLRMALSCPSCSEGEVVPDGDGHWSCEACHGAGQLDLTDP